MDAVLQKHICKAGIVNLHASHTCELYGGKPEMKIDPSLGKL